MPVEVACPGCGAKLKAPSDRVGKKARCGKCHKSFRIPGGASRETWKVQAATAESRRGLIVRIDPETSLIDTDRATEYRAIAE